MKSLKRFTRKREQELDSRIYNVGSPRVAKRYQPVPRNVPEPDPIFGDTGSLELKDETADEANPYDTASWSLDPEKGLRRVEDDKTVSRDDRDTPQANNPYDTGTFRRGW